jgi:hypothetical protein
LRRLLAWLGAFALMVVLTATAAAAAQGDAPHLDPTSPAGTEYQLPADRARQDASGGGSSGSGGTAGATPLFGAGVEGNTPPARKRPSARDGARSAAGNGSHTPKKSPTGPRTTTTTTAPAPAPAAVEQPELGKSTPEIARELAPGPDGGGGSMLAVAGIAAGVLLIGALAGLAWRRVMRS